MSLRYNDKKITLKTHEFSRIQKMLYSYFGLHLTAQKKTMVESRLRKILYKYQLNSFTDYCSLLRTDKSGKMLVELINTLTTNHTYFWREPDHFRFFQNHVLPYWDKELGRKNDKNLRIWSAGCSSGEEPYMLEILMLEYFKKRYSLWNAGVLATDLSQKVLAFAMKGLYPKERLKKLSPKLTHKYFYKMDDKYKVKSFVKKEILYRKFNLMNKFPFKNKFHAIFCKNVMIYFDKKTRLKLVQKFYDKLEDKGYLFIGLSESLGNDTNFKYIQPSIYRKI